MPKEYRSIVIEPRRGWFSLEWGELWRFRELFHTLVWRDIKVRYKQTVLGAAWAVFQPLISMLIFTLFFGVLVKVPSDNIPYPIFAYAGLLLWTLFSNGVTRASTSLLSDPNLISKIYFPRLIVPIASFGACIVDFFISLLILVVMMAYYRVTPSLSMILVPLLVIITVMASLGVGIILAALSVAYRDVKYIAPFFIQIWMYASPVIYPVSIVPQKWRWVLSLNPMCGAINGCRSAIFGKPFDWPNLAVSMSISVFLLIIGLLYFKKAEYRFADII
jgi:lipopolysaccharide transport system permease protein